MKACMPISKKKRWRTRMKACPPCMQIFVIRYYCKFATDRKTGRVFLPNILMWIQLRHSNNPTIFKHKNERVITKQSNRTYIPTFTDLTLYKLCHYRRSIACFSTVILTERIGGGECQSHSDHEECFCRMVKVSTCTTGKPSFHLSF